MRSMLLAFLTMFLIPSAAFADFNLGPGTPELPDRPGRPGRPTRPGNGDSFILIQPACDITDIILKVTVDRFTVDSVGLLYDDGEVEYVPVNQHIPKNTYSRWLQVDSYRRCVEGFSINGKGDFDLQAATITVIGHQQRRYRSERNIILGSTTWSAVV